jgi:hypothetical protein
MASQLGGGAGHPIHSRTWRMRRRRSRDVSRSRSNQTMVGTLIGSLDLLRSAIHNPTVNNATKEVVL